MLAGVAAQTTRGGSTHFFHRIPPEERGNAAAGQAAVHPAYGRASRLSSIALRASGAKRDVWRDRLLRRRRRSTWPRRGPRRATTAPGAGMKPAAGISAAASFWGGRRGRKYQGGTGAYRTDGPVMPDLIYATTSTINSLGRSERFRMIGRESVEGRDSAMATRNGIRLERFVRAGRSGRSDADRESRRRSWRRSAAPR